MKRARKLGPPKRYLFSYTWCDYGNPRTTFSLNYGILTKRRGLPTVKFPHGNGVLDVPSLRRVK